MSTADDFVSVLPHLGSMRDLKNIVIFGGQDDERVVWLKCLLLKCGVCNFADGCFDAERCRRMIEERSVGLFIVSRESVGPNEMEGINATAQMLSVPVLHL
jgi:hypothetical protein